MYAIYDILPTLTHCSLETLNGYLANSADPDQTPQNMATDQDLHCLQIVQPSLGICLIAGCT